MNKKLAMGGFMAAMLFGIGVGAYADSVITEVKAYINKDIKLSMNGNNWTPKDADGEAQSPLIYHGSTYLPLRSIGEISGLGIDWEPTTKTIKIQSKTTASLPESEPYKDAANYGMVQYPLYNKTIYSAPDILRVHQINENISFDLSSPSPESSTIIGQTPDQSFYISYFLYKAAKRLTGTFETNSLSMDANVQFAVLDVSTGSTLFSSTISQNGSDPIPFDIDVTGVNQVSIVAAAKFNTPGTITAIIKDLTVVADKTTPESTFDLAKHISKD